MVSIHFGKFGKDWPPTGAANGTQKSFKTSDVLRERLFRNFESDLTVLRLQGKLKHDLSQRAT